MSKPLRTFREHCQTVNASLEESAALVLGGVVAGTAATIIVPMIQDLIKAGKNAAARRAGKEWDTQSDAWLDIRDWQSKKITSHKTSWNKLFQTVFASMDSMPDKDKKTLKDFERRFSDILSKISRHQTTATGALARQGHQDFKALEAELQDLQSDIRYWAVRVGLMNAGVANTKGSDGHVPSSGDGWSSS